MGAHSVYQGGMGEGKGHAGKSVRPLTHGPVPSGGVGANYTRILIFSYLQGAEG